MKEFPKVGKISKKLTKDGAKILGVYWRSGRCDAVFMADVSDEKRLMKEATQWGDMAFYRYHGRGDQRGGGSAGNVVIWGSLRAREATSSRGRP